MTTSDAEMKVSAVTVADPPRVVPPAIQKRRKFKIVGLALAANGFVDKVLSPFLVPLNSLPRIALAPLFIVWFGLTDTSKVVLGVSVVFFVMAFNTIAGLRGTDSVMSVAHSFVVVVIVFDASWRPLGSTGTMVGVRLRAIDSQSDR